MCKNLQPIDDEEAIVYKIVARKKKGTRYYSIAMGFKYPKIAGRIPKVKRQHCLGFFSTNLLVIFYRDKMLGRTAGFISKTDAERIAGSMKYGNMTMDYDILVVKAELTDGLMSGTYDNYFVIAGRHIEFLE